MAKSRVSVSCYHVNSGEIFKSCVKTLLNYTVALYDICSRIYFTATVVSFIYIYIYMQCTYLICVYWLVVWNMFYFQTYNRMIPPIHPASWQALGQGRLMFSSICRAPCLKNKDMPWSSQLDWINPLSNWISLGDHSLK